MDVWKHDVASLNIDLVLTLVRLKISLGSKCCYKHFSTQVNCFSLLSLLLFSSMGLSHVMCLKAMKASWSIRSSVLCL